MHYPSTHLLTVFPLRGRTKASIPAAFRREVAYTLDKSPVYHTSNDEQPFTLTFLPEDNACLWTVVGSWYQRDAYHNNRPASQRNIKTERYTPNTTNSIGFKDLRIQGSLLSLYRAR